MAPRVQVPPDIKGRVAGSVYPPARQDLSGAVNGQIRGANGGMQDLGAAALRRLGGGGSGQTPGIVPPMPTGTPPNPGGNVISGDEPFKLPPGGIQGGASPYGGNLAPGYPTMTSPKTPWGGGPQSLGGQNVQDPISIGQAQPGVGSAMVTDSMPGGYGGPGTLTGQALANQMRQDGTDVINGGVNGAGDGGASTFPLVQQALQQMTPNEPMQKPDNPVGGMGSDVMTKPFFQPTGSGQTPPIANVPGVGGASPGAGITPKPAFNPTGSPWHSPDTGGSSIAPKPMTGGGLFGPGSNPVLAQIRQRMLQQKPMKPNQIAGGGGVRNITTTPTGQPLSRQMEY